MFYFKPSACRCRGKNRGRSGIGQIQTESDWWRIRWGQRWALWGERVRLPFFTFNCNKLHYLAWHYRALLLHILHHNTQVSQCIDMLWYIDTLVCIYIIIHKHILHSCIMIHRPMMCYRQTPAQRSHNALAASGCIHKQVCSGQCAVRDTPEWLMVRVTKFMEWWANTRMMDGVWICT